MTIYVITGQAGFFSDERIAPPDGAQPISDELHAFLIDQEAQGLVIQWDVYPPVAADAPPAGEEVLAADARAKRDSLLRNVYDTAVAMLQRAQRMGISGAEAKLAEFDAWAVALQAIPEQSGFPHNIDWPTQPSKEL